MVKQHFIVIAGRDAQSDSAIEIRGSKPANDVEKAPANDVEKVF